MDMIDIVDSIDRVQGLFQDGLLVDPSTPKGCKGLDLVWNKLVDKAQQDLQQPFRCVWK